GSEVQILSPRPVINIPLVGFLLQWLSVFYISTYSENVLHQRNLGKIRPGGYETLKAGGTTNDQGWLCRE
ncbi:MAG: hypothetical protein ABIU05_11980, partial [Nitrospirales bacterium]